jgi:hypothetical protein
VNRAFLILFLCWSTGAVFAQSTASERVHFSGLASGELKVQINASEPISATALRPGIEGDGVRLQAEDGAIAITATSRPIALEVGEVRGEIPAGTTLRVVARATEVSFETPSLNRENVRLAFSDSATALLPRSARGQAEFLDDGSYSFTASTNVFATTADGQTFRFGRQSGPMFGGKLIETTDARGNPRFLRSNPAVRIELAGDGEKEVRIASPAVTLVPGQERLLTFTNGARLFLKHSPEKNTLEWRVVRGVCQFGIAGFSCWKATAVSGQSGTLQWNSHRRAVDLRHAPASSGYVTAQLSSRVSASVASGATFQYAQFQDCGSFAASGIGDAQLLDRETGETLPLAQGVISYNEGARVAGSAVGRPFNPVSLAWDSDSRVELRGSAGSVYPVSAGTELTAQIGEDSIAIAFRTDNSVLIRAREGNFNLRGTFLPDVSFDIPEGGAVILRLNRQRMVFTAEAAADTGADIRVLSAGQTYLYLAGSARVMIVLGQNSLLPEGNTAWTFFEGAGGEQTFLPSQQPADVISPGRIAVDRIVQEPVSVIE